MDKSKLGMVNLSDILGAERCSATNCAGRLYTDPQATKIAEAADTTKAGNDFSSTGFAACANCADTANPSALMNSDDFIGAADFVNFAGFANFANSACANSARLERGASAVDGAGLASSASSIHSAALNHLSRREYSAKELADKLINKGFAPAQVEQELTALQAKGWQSDQRFAESLLRSRLAAGYGPRHIARELQMKGVDSAIIETLLDGESALEAGSLDWRQQAKLALARRFGRRATLISQSESDESEDGGDGDNDNAHAAHAYEYKQRREGYLAAKTATKKEKEKQFRYLLRKGFEIDLIKELLNERDEG